MSEIFLTSTCCHLKISQFWKMAKSPIANIFGQSSNIPKTKLIISEKDDDSYGDEENYRLLTNSADNNYQ